MKWVLAMTYCMLAWGLGGISWAEDEGPSSDSKRGWLLEKFDANGDGKLDSQEREAARKAKILRKFDANGDGELGPEEKKAAKAAKRAHILKNYDANGDGKLDSKEREVARKAYRDRHGNKRNDRGRLNNRDRFDHKGQPQGQQGRRKPGGFDEQRNRRPPSTGPNRRPAIRSTNSHLQFRAGRVGGRILVYEQEQASRAEV